ncbi:MAG TPA: DNA polymerase/3'-5' exonuclease PolX [Solirubrobacteraceae bacterium]|nr:DNA polymerase/3'-5' exonuclease PolX [Solirubrobacteraceae bacterium]
MADPTNAQIADALDELGDLYELDGAIVHRVVAYRNAARAVREATVSVAALAREGKATQLPGIGRTIQDKVLALAQEGAIPAAVRLRARFPPGLLEVMRLPGLGPRRARRLFEELSIDSLQSLEAAAREHRIRALRGFGPKAEQRILEAVAAARAGAAGGGDGSRRVPLHRALAVAEPLLEALRAHPAAVRVALAGSARRMADTVKDLDIVASSADPMRLATAAAGLELVESAQSPSESGVRLRAHAGLSVDLRIVSDEQFGNLLQHLTGSKEHNVALRDAAVRRGLHISEYGVLDDSTGTTRRCSTEQELYALLGLDYIEPELREGRGELEAAAHGRLPRLIQEADLRGDLHCHTTTSDGTASIEEMALAACECGYEYLAITDHSASFGFGDEVSAERLAEHAARVRELSGTPAVGGITLLAGTEVNILPDGSLDYDDDTLAMLDWVVASVHTSMRMEAAAMTRRIVRAISNPLVDCLGHPFGRRIGRRAPYELDFQAVLDAAAATGTMLEINSSPERRDLDDPHARAAAAAGVPLVIDSDAHRTEGFRARRFGVATARRAWLEAGAVANTRPWEQVAAMRPRARR